MSEIISKSKLLTTSGLASRLILWLVAALAASGAQAQTTVEYIHTDALGSPVAVTDASGNVIERSEYAPYGELLNRPQTDGPGYTGHVQDASTGLTYMQQRYYDPGVGRFLSVDPVEADPHSGGLFNRYMYAANNPYTFIDPDGRCTGSRIENGDGTCVSTGDFTTMGGGPTMPGAQTVVHQASIEAQAGVHGAGGISNLYAGNDNIPEPLYCSSVADCDFMYNQDQFLKRNISREEFDDRTIAQGKAGVIGASLVAAPEGAAAVRLVFLYAKFGWEISGKNWRVAPFGNRTGHPQGRWPHYHRRGTVDPKTGQPLPGKGLNRHRPWEKKDTDKSFWERF